MNKNVIDKLTKYFKEPEFSLAMKELKTIKLKHVMSDTRNLCNIQITIIDLSKGDLEGLKILVKSAREDFRDLIYWHSQNA